jgi:hypothetical protein
MNNRQQFAADALAGGWKVPDWLEGYSLDENYIQASYHEYMSYEHMLLDPLAWQAVGKTRGWNNETAYTTLNHDDVPYGEGAEIMHWHCFIDHLAEGKTIDEALSSLI